MKMFPHVGVGAKSVVSITQSIYRKKRTRINAKRNNSTNPDFFYVINAVAVAAIFAASNPE